MNCLQVKRRQKLSSKRRDTSHLPDGLSLSATVTRGSKRDTVFADEERRTQLDDDALVCKLRRRHGQVVAPLPGHIADRSSESDLFSVAELVERVCCLPRPGYIGTPTSQTRRRSSDLSLQQAR